MPRFDRTGPEGKGSKTGRGLGDCSEKKNVKPQVNWPNRFSRRKPGRRWGIWSKSRHIRNEENE